MENNPALAKEPEQPTQAKKIPNVWIITATLLLIALCSLVAYLFEKNLTTSQTTRTMQSTATQAPVSQSPLATVIPTITNSVANSITNTLTPTSSIDATGTATGKLCYPASGIPPGTITAKNTTTAELITQSYLGTESGAPSSYTLSLKPGTYHLKFTPTDFSTVIGYYTDYSSCVGNPNGSNCSGQKSRPLLPVVIESGKTVQEVNLCDYYYPPDNPPQF